MLERAIFLETEPQRLSEDKQDQLTQSLRNNYLSRSRIEFLRVNYGVWLDLFSPEGDQSRFIKGW